MYKIEIEIERGIIKRSLVVVTLLLVALLNSYQLSAQEELPTMNERNLAQIILPPISKFYEGVRGSSRVDYYNLIAEGEEHRFKSEKRKWLEVFSFHASFQYGVMAMINQVGVGYDYPPIYQYHNQDQEWYSIGASIRLPLDLLFDRNNRVRRQRLKVDESRMERELWHDEQKLRVAELYATALESLNRLQYVVELFAIADGQYLVAQADYELGVIEAHALTVAKAAQVDALAQLEQVKNSLIEALLKLEILTGVEVINFD